MKRINLQKMSKNILLKNIYQTKCIKNCLLIYVIKPFVKIGKATHPNYYKALLISKSIREMGYNVDVIYYGFTRKINYKKYDLIIGMGEGYTKSFGQCKSNCKRVYLATGTCFLTANQLELKRWIDLMDKQKCFNGIHRLDIESDPVLTLQSLYYSDAIIGGSDSEWVQDSYAWTKCPYYSVGSLSIINHPITINKDINKCRSGILFLCGGGTVHKGLDIVLEAIVKRADYRLFIVGNIDEGFVKSYSNEILNSNVELFGYINANSLEFERICEKCGYIVSMSCSEGCCTSVLTGMNMGLIPIVSRADGVRIEDSGFMMEQPSAQCFEKALNDANKLSDNQMQYRMKRAKEIIESNYSIDCFYRKVLKSLEEIVKNE